MPDEESSSDWLGQYVLNDQGEPMPERDLLTWARWMETAARVVERSYIADLWISTVFLGLDHGLPLMQELLDNPLGYRPILWETMVFRGHEPIDMERYRSRQEAVAGHERMVEKYLRETTESAAANLRALFREPH